jgi:hypothetical protein
VAIFVRIPAALTIARFNKKMFHSLATSPNSLPQWIERRSANQALEQLLRREAGAREKGLL